MSEKNSNYNSGWLEAAVAWEVCASIHQQFAKGKDAVFKTRQADFRRHADECRQRFKDEQAKLKTVVS